MSTVNNELGHHREDLRTRVECEERQQMMRRSERVNGWLQSAALLGSEVDVILQNGVQELQKIYLLNWNCYLRYRLGMTV